MKTSCIIRIDGNDITSTIMPRLINLSVVDKAGASSDTVSIEIDDRDGIILFPRSGAKIEVLLGKGQVEPIFRGEVDEVRSTGSRSAGTVMTISGKGMDTKGKAKQTAEKHWDDAELETVFSDAAKDAGITNVKVDPELSKVKRPYWAMQGESFIHFGERVAREVGGTFKISGDTAILAKRNGGKSASGEDLPPVYATYADNLIAWDITPVMGRPRYKAAKSRWYDTKTATWKYEDIEIDDEGAEAEFSPRYPAADDEEAKEKNKSRKEATDREKGGGSVTIDGSPDPQPEALLIVSGARPGIDGQYRIDTVTHEFSRGSGWTTRIDIKQPHGEAGKDKRKDTKSSSATGDGFNPDDYDL